MNIEIFDAQQNTNKTIRLRLVQEGLAVVLVAVDQDGATLPYARLLNIRFDGSLYLCPKINENLGFQLTHEGRFVTHPL